LAPIFVDFDGLFPTDVARQIRLLGRWRFQKDNSYQGFALAMPPKVKSLSGFSPQRSPAQYSYESVAANVARLKACPDTNRLFLNCYRCFKYGNRPLSATTYNKGFADRH
jgi:hypothetical protein